MEEIFGTNGENAGDGSSPENFAHGHRFDLDEPGNKVTEDNSIRDVQEGPKTGDIFSSVDSLVKFFQEHAKLKGFGVAKRSAHKGKHEEYKYVTICCDRGRCVHFEKHSKRMNCPVRINAIKRDLGFWEVSKVESTHNHDLHPGMSCPTATPKNSSVNLKRQVEANNLNPENSSVNLKRRVEADNLSPEHSSVNLKRQVEVENLKEEVKKLRGEIKEFNRRMLKDNVDLKWMHCLIHKFPLTEFYGIFLEAQKEINEETS